MAAIDPAFRHIPKHSTFFYIWRIEKMQVVPVPKDSYGIFYTGDSYIIACATEGNEKGWSQMKPREAKGYLNIHIHFWLGKFTSQDEAGVAAYKTVELDDYMGGTPIQHREAQGFETKRFLSYFKKGIRLLEGGVASGLNHVITTLEPQLFQIKGKRKPTVKQLGSISWSLMNDGDVFLVNTDEAVFIWTGKYSNNMEKIQGAKVAQQLRFEAGNNSRPIIIVEDGHEKSLPQAEREYFNKLLPVNQKNIKSHTEGGQDEVVERKVHTDIKLYRCSDEDGTLKVTEVKNGPLDQRDLQSQDSFIIDNGESGIWVWVGKRASNKERSEAMRNAQGFVKKKGYPNHTQVTRVIDGGEPSEFKSLFRSWLDVNQTVGFQRQISTTGKIAKTVQTKFDASTLHENTHLAAEMQMVDDGTGSKEVFHVVNFDLVPLEENERGNFYSGDCYVVVYAYSDGKKDHYIVYYWIGLHSSVDEQATAAMKTVELDDKLHGQAVQVRVVQGKEPPHFMAIFGGKMIILQGGAKSGFNNTEETSRTSGLGEKYLLQVRGTSEYNTKAIQVDFRAGSLNSNDVFVMATRDTTYIWAGKGSTGDEREMAKRIANENKKDIVLVYEGQEKGDFWDAIGGKEPYANDKRLQDSNSGYLPRLYQISNASGRFTVEEIMDFDQSDLVEEDVMLLDAWDVLFLWIGAKSNADEQKFASAMAMDYLKTDPCGRDVNTPVVKLRQGHEPPNFVGFFGTWDTSFWNNEKTYEQIRSELAATNPGLFIYHPQTNGGGTSSDIISEYEKFPLEALLVKDPSQLPDGVNPTQKELYLSGEDFKIAFGMSYSEFLDIPHWKQQNLKKQAGLF